MPTRQPLEAQQVTLVKVRLVSSQMTVTFRGEACARDLSEETRRVAVNNLAKLGQQHELFTMAGDLNVGLDKLSSEDFHIWGEEPLFKGLVRSLSTTDHGAEMKSDCHEPVGGVYGRASQRRQRQLLPRRAARRCRRPLLAGLPTRAPPRQVVGLPTRALPRQGVQTTGWPRQSCCGAGRRGSAPTAGRRHSQSRWQP